MRSLDEAALLAAADLETRNLLGDIDGAQGVWILTAEGTQVAHSGRIGSGSTDTAAICAAMSLLGVGLSARANTGIPRSLVLETSTSRWVMQSLTMTRQAWIVVVLTDRTSLLAWVSSRISLANQRLSGAVGAAH